MVKNRYDLQIFLSSTFDQSVMRDMREAFRNEINARLNYMLGLLGANAYVVDLQLGIPKGTDALRTLEICLERICDSDCFVFVLSDTYGKQNTRAFLMGESPTGLDRIGASPYAQTIRTGMDKGLYIIELEALQADQVPHMDGNRLFFFDRKIPADSGSYTAQIMNGLMEGHKSKDSIFRFYTLGDIKDQFIRFFEQRYSQKFSALDGLQQDKNAYSAAVMRYYVENKEGIALLEAYRTDDSRDVFLLTGPQGSGKSALLLDWISRIESKTKVFSCFVNYKRNSLREVLADLYQQSPDLDIRQMMWLDETMIVEKFYSFLETVGRAGPTVVVIDGMDQIRRERGASPYTWFPRILPENVKLVLSTNAVNIPGCILHALPPVNVMDILRQMLKSEGKELETDTIAGALKASTFQAVDLPVFARMLYQEITELFHYNDIQEKLIEHLNQTGSTERLADAFLRRLSARFGDMLVKESLALISLAQYGLTIGDLQAMVRAPQAEELVYLLYLEIRTDGMSRMTFAHRYFTDAVRRVFCWEDTFVRKCRTRIFEWFAAKDINGPNILEAAYQLYALKDTPRMVSYLGYFRTASFLFKGNPYQVGEEDSDPYRVLQLTSILSNRELLLKQWRTQKIDKKDLLWVAIFTAMAERYGEARKMFSKVLKRDLAPGRRSLAHEWVAKTFHGLGDYEAEERFRHISRTWEKHERRGVRENQEELVAAERAYYASRTDETRAAFLGAYEAYYGRDSLDVGNVLHNIASQFVRDGDFTQAIQYYLRALDIFTAIYGEEHSETMQVYHNLASAYAQNKDYDLAIRYFGKALPFMEEHLGRLHPELGALYNNLGGLYYLRGQYHDALKYLHAARKICKAQYGWFDSRTIENWKNIGLVTRRLYNYR